VALLCRGHALVEDVPGTGKTILARATAASLDLRFRRIQCTPDLLPSDITGVRVFHQHSGSFEFQPGPVFTNVLLADEINRATPRTQSALLQAMEEGEVTVDGLPQSLPRPFLVLATQNPIEFEGTFPLPEAQLDRFLLRLSLGYPEGSDEIGIVHAQARGHPVAQLGPVLAADELLLLSGFIADVYMHPDLERYLLRIVHATRRHPALLLGASTRATVGLYRSAQALAALRGREYVAPEDIKEMAPPVLMHRLVLRPEELIRNVSAHAVVAQILEETHVDADEA
jgi:MoxR-like ATPase